MDAAFLSDLVTANLPVLDARVNSGDWRCFLLKRNGQTKKCTVVLEITANLFVKFDEFTNTMLFEHSPANTATFPDAIAQSDYIGYGVPDADEQIEMFEIDPDERRRTAAPTNTGPLWKVYAIKMPAERFTVSTL